MKECRWMTYHLTVHAIITHMNKKANELVIVLELGTYSDSVLE